MRVRVVGFGMGPQHVTPEAAEALASCDYVVAAQKRDEDPLLAVRQAVVEAYAPGREVVAVPDPERDRRPADEGGYGRAVQDWHGARVDAYDDVLRARGGTAAMLVWGDPSLYDSSLRIVAALAERGTVAEYDVVPGISAPQLLAARHRIVLHEVGRPVHVTTGRRLREAIDDGQGNVVAMLNSATSLRELEACGDASIWWGANLGAAGEELVAGRLPHVLPEILLARERAAATDGWVMDLFLLRRDATEPST